jgi:hypothetical protein
MKFEELRTHIGCLVHIKTELYWYDGRHWGGITERFCILLDIGSILDDKAAAGHHAADEYNLQLLLDCRPQWIILGKKSFEVVK